MQKINKSACKRESSVFKALGHPTRLWIVKQLAEGEHCVCEFVASADVKFATISQHLRILKQAGIIDDEKRGKAVYYHLKCPCILNMIECMSKNK